MTPAFLSDDDRVAWAAYAAAMAAVLTPPALALVAVKCFGVGRRKRGVPASAAAPRLVPYTSAAPEDCLAVDCTHPSVPALTHHRGNKTPSELRADTSGGIVLNAARARHSWVSSNRRVTCNHFDMDGLVAVYAALQPKEALEHEALLREAAHVGDFRELDLERPHGHAALSLNVWVNSVERARFYRPFNGSEADGALRKYAHFLPRLPAALALADACAEFVGTLAPPGSVLREAAAEFDTEHARVLADVACLGDAGASAVRFTPALGLVSVDCPRPLHYYALFGATRGADTVLALYPGQRYELECKYTGFVQLVSRPTLPRLDLVPLAAALTAAELARGAAGVAWVANSVVDSGPMMRLEGTDGKKASKAERYAHPYERDILQSTLAPPEFERAVRSYFSHGLKGVKPRTDWSWSDIHELNAGIDWAAWRATCKLEGVKAD